MDTAESDRITDLLDERPHAFSPDYYYTSGEFGSRWEDAGSAELANAIVGYDPLFVTFMDESHSRTFPIKTWEIDFGDGYFYGLTSGERAALAEYIASGTTANYAKYMSASPYYDPAEPFIALSAAFELPGDITILTTSGMQSKKYTETRHVEQFKVTSIMTPKDYKFVEDGNPLNVRYPIARELCRDENKNRPGRVHVTSIEINAKKTDVGEDSYGLANTLEVDSVDWGSSRTFEYNEIFKRPAVGANIFFNNMRGDDCSHVGMKFANKGTDRPIVGHMYKGPGVYTATFRIKPSSSADYYGQLLSASNFSEPGIEYLTKTIVVRPTCPCIKTKVYDTYFKQDGEIVKDPRSGHNVFARRNGKLMHAVLSSEDYSADDPENYGDGESYIDFNPEIFRLYNANKEKLFEGVSGYAPFVMASVKGLVRPNSFPISAVGIDHGDWFVDRIEDDEEAEVSAYSKGWPFWTPRSVDGENAYWDEKRRAFYMTNTHTFVMPGLYRANAVVRYDKERIPDFWWSELSACDQKGTGSYYVLVKEIFPKDPKITYLSGYTEPDGANVHAFSFSARAGSFPIEDVEWNFGDGSEPLILTRNASGGYASREIIKGNTTAIYTGDSSAYWYDPHGIDYGALDASAGSAFAALPEYVETSGVYPEFDPRKWMVRHKFYRTAVEDANGKLVSAMCYAANTHSMALATSIVGLSGLPDFRTVEGNVRVVDTRLTTYDDNLVVTMEGNNGTFTNLYTLEWKGDSNDA